MLPCRLQFCRSVFVLFKSARLESRGDIRHILSKCSYPAGRTKERGPVTLPKRVAIVDDDRRLLLSISGLLRSFGIEALTFQSAEEFLQARPSGVDCLLADVHMLGMNGLEMIEKLREDGNKVPIIVLSALDPEVTRAEALARGANAYFAKPVDSDELMQCMALLMDARDEIDGD